MAISHQQQHQLACSKKTVLAPSILGRPGRTGAGACQSQRRTARSSAPPCPPALPHPSLQRSLSVLLWLLLPAQQATAQTKGFLGSPGGHRSEFSKLLAFLGSWLHPLFQSWEQLALAVGLLPPPPTSSLSLTHSGPPNFLLEALGDISARSFMQFQHRATWFSASVALGLGH